jgi:type IV pilus assembly protein PilP
MRNALSVLASCLAIVFLLGGCSDDRSDLSTWMQEERKAAPKPKARIAEPKKFEPYRYEHADVKDPFASANLLAALERASGKKDNGLAPDTRRAREELESYPIDSLRLVGHLQTGRQQVGLIQSASGMHKVRVGNYVGQNFGIVTRVSENEIKVKELVQDASGDWAEREVALQLQESKETKK